MPHHSHVWLGPVPSQLRGLHTPLPPRLFWWRGFGRCLAFLVYSRGCYDTCLRLLHDYTPPLFLFFGAGVRPLCRGRLRLPLPLLPFIYGLDYEHPTSICCGRWNYRLFWSLPWFPRLLVLNFVGGRNPTTPPPQLCASLQLVHTTYPTCGLAPDPDPFPAPHSLPWLPFGLDGQHPAQFYQRTGWVWGPSPPTVSWTPILDGYVSPACFARLPHRCLYHRVYLQQVTRRQRLEQLPILYLIPLLLAVLYVIISIWLDGCFAFGV